MKFYKITWLDTADKDGNRPHQTTTMRMPSLTIAIQELCALFGISEDDIILIEHDTTRDN